MNVWIESGHRAGVRVAAREPALSVIAMKLLPIGALMLISSSATAMEVRAPIDHEVGLGTRAGSWIGTYAAPGVGGHLKLRLFEDIGIEAFSDNFARIQDHAWRHDHVIGFSLYAPSLIAGDSWFIAPTLGTCVDFRFAHPIDSDAPSTSDILFGVHGGLMAEAFVGYGFSFEATATMYAYIGHESDVQRWSAEISNELGVTPLGLVLASVNYYFE